MFFLTLAALAAVAMATEDTFNYGETVGISYGPPDWGHVKCDDIATCVSYDCTILALSMTAASPT
jgi:hypothetical protein